MDVLMKRGYDGFHRLDSGGQANVYKSLKDGKLYAIKVVQVKSSNEAKLDDDPRREMTILSAIKHPNCLKVEDLFRTESK